MFGLSFEKLFLVAIIAAVVIGPQRLPLYTHRLAELIRSLRRLVDTSKAQVESEIGISREELEALDVRRYDPRRIVRDALSDPSPAPVEVVAPSSVEPSEQTLAEEASRVRPGQKYLVTGNSARPRRILIASLPENDPRRLAAYVPPPAENDEPELLLDEVTHLLEQPTPDPESARLSHQKPPSRR